MAVEANVFYGRGQILLLRDHHRGEFNTIIVIDTPLAWGEVPSSSSIAISPSP
jgi:hypothetical protein